MKSTPYLPASFWHGSGSDVLALKARGRGRAWLSREPLPQLLGRLWPLQHPPRVRHYRGRLHLSGGKAHPPYGSFYPGYPKYNRGDTRTTSWLGELATRRDTLGVGVVGDNDELRRDPQHPLNRWEHHRPGPLHVAKTLQSNGAPARFLHHLHNRVRTHSAVKG